MINNFDKIRPLLKFPNENSFYFLEILKRRKENPEMERHAKLVRDYYIYSLDYFDEISGDVINLCHEHNARAYFRLNVRDAKKVAHQFLKRLSELLITEDYKAIQKSYASVVGEFHSDPDKTWVVDIDEPEEKFDVDFIKAKIRGIYQAHNKNEEPIVVELPTKNGIHLITKPFRLDVFKQEFPNVDVHKDNPTILYMP